MVAAVQAAAALTAVKSATNFSIAAIMAQGNNNANGNNNNNNNNNNVIVGSNPGSNSGSATPPANTRLEESNYRKFICLLSTVLLRPFCGLKK